MFESLSYRHVNLLHSPRANNCRIYLCKGDESSERHAQIIIQQELFNTHKKCMDIQRIKYLSIQKALTHGRYRVCAT
jgi:hypothetical protein